MLQPLTHGSGTLSQEGRTTQKRKRKRLTKTERNKKKRARERLEAAKGTPHSEEKPLLSHKMERSSKGDYSKPSILEPEIPKRDSTTKGKDKTYEEDGGTTDVSPCPVENQLSFGSHSFTKRSVEFVYPKQSWETKKKRMVVSMSNKNQSAKPYVHTKLRNVDTVWNGTAKTNEKDHDGHGVTSKAAPPPINESLNDILYPNRKKKMMERMESSNANQSKLQAVNGHGGHTKGRMKHLTNEHTSTQNNGNGHSDYDIAQAKENSIRKNASKKEKTDLNKNGRKKEDTKQIKPDSVSNKTKKGHLESESLANGSITCTKSQQKSDETKELLIKPVLKRQLSGLTVEDAVKDKIGRRPRCNSTDGELNLPRGGLCDEHSVLESHKWDLDKLYGRKVSKPTLPRGFENTGNTCFLNATLQCLAYLPTFCQCVANLPSHQERNVNGKKLSNGQRISMYLRNFLHKVHDLPGESHKQAGRPVQPKNVAPMLNGSNSGYKFRHGRQEDAHEFLVHLLDTMHDGELKGAGEGSIRK